MPLSGLAQIQAVAAATKAGGLGPSREQRGEGEAGRKVEFRLAPVAVKPGRARGMLRLGYWGLSRLRRLGVVAEEGGSSRNAPRGEHSTRLFRAFMGSERRHAV